jgi:formamidopyrimidine-DNA glycosylase
MPEGDTLFVTARVLNRALAGRRVEAFKTSRDLGAVPTGARVVAAEAAAASICSSRSTTAACCIPI